MGLRPIIFNDEMVRAILSGKKTQTRRALKLLPSEKPNGKLVGDLGYPASLNWAWVEIITITGSKIYKKCPYGGIGDTLYVREGWRVSSGYDALKPSLVKVAMGGDYVGCVDYKATPRTGDFWGRWRPSIHMPKEFSRIWLKIVDIRAERLWGISEDDCKQEGIQSFLDGYRDYGSREDSFVGPRASFFSLWDSINEKRGYGYDKNPWVWVVEFEKFEKIEIAPV